MALISILIGSITGFASFWVAYLGADFSFWNAFGIYWVTGMITSIVLMLTLYFISRMPPQTPDLVLTRTGEAALQSG